MIKHIVIWKLKDEAHGNSKRVNALRIKEKLEALKDKIPEIQRIDVGIDFSNTPESGDVVLYMEFNSREDLQVYQNHPEHQAVIPFIREARLERRVVDYEI